MLIDLQLVMKIVGDFFGAAAVLIHAVAIAHRDAAVGAVGHSWGGSGGQVVTIIPGLKTPHYGTPVSNDFWLSTPDCSRRIQRR